MTSVGWATLQIIPSADGFSKNISKQTRPGMAAAGRTGGKAYGGGMLAAGRSFVAPLAAIFAGTAITGFFKDAIAGAAEFQTASKVTERAFGAGAKAIQKWAGDSSKSFAFTENEALKLANNLGFVASQAGGLAGKELTAFTKQSLEVAQALNVVNDVPVERTMLAIQNAVAGNSQALKNLGYDISEDILKKKALAMGAKEVDGEISKLARTQALHKLIMEQSQGPLENMNKAQGDATAQALLAQRQFDDLKGTIGNALLPVWNQALSALNSWIPALNDWVGGLINGGGAAGKFGKQVRNVLGKAIQFVKPIFEAMGPVLGTLRDAFETIWPSIQQAATTIWEILGPALTEIRNLIANQVLPAFQQFIDAIAPVVSWLIEKLAPVVAFVFEGIVQVIKGALNIITGVLKVFTGLFTGDWNKLWDGIKQIFTGVWQFLQGFIVTKIGLIGKVIRRGANLMRSTIGKALNWIRGRWNAVWSWVGNFLRSIWNRISSAIAGAVGRIRSRISRFLSGIRNLWDNAWNAIFRFIGRILGRIVTAVGNRLKRVVNFFKNLPGRIKSGLGNLGSLLLSAGMDLIRGLINGIKRMGGRAVEAAKGVVNDAVQSAKNLLRIKSPSRVFMEIGEYTAEGLALGMTKGSKGVAKAARNMAGVASANGSPVTSAARPWSSHGGTFGAAGGTNYIFNARTVDVTPEQVEPLQRRADARKRVGLVR